MPLFAAGGSLAGLPAHAIELGGAVVDSRLGQPLRASIAYALAPNEQIADTCVSIGGRRLTDGLPGIGQASVKITNGAIVVTGETPIREPMVSATLVINCPYTANLAREYMMFIDPADTVVEPRAAVPAAQPATQPTVSAPSVTRPAATAAPITRSTRYRVQPGDSLSVIAQRIENRPVGLWTAVNAIFAANPDAFMDNDPNKLKAGSWLEIPSFDGTAPVVAAAPVAAPVEPVATPVEPVVPTASVYDPYAADTAPASDTARKSDSTSIVEPVADPVETQVAPAETLAPVSTPEPVVEVTEDTTRDLRPGDIIVDAELEGPVTESASPNVPTASISTDAAGETTEAPQTPWMLWLAGGGLALLFAVLLVGRRLRSRFGPSPAAVATPVVHGVDEATENIEVMVDEDYDLDDDSPTAENLALDADLFVGTGLEEGTDMEVAEDFGFASPTEVDIELPFEPIEAPPTMETDIIPPVHTDSTSILDSEIMPDDDEYDMSVIVDATKMPQPEDVTERDLKAVEVEPDDEDTDAYTINRESDFDMLERDYEDEMTATQALNQEIQRAAEELAERMDEDSTSEMPLATVTELDVTAQLPRKDEDVDDPDATSETAAVSGEDKTEEMVAVSEDDTVEMDVEGGKVDTRAG